MCQGRCQAQGLAGVSGAGNGAVLHWLKRRHVLGLVNVPTGKDACNVGNVCARVGLSLITFGTALFSAVEVQFIQPDGHQLHDLAAIVFVWHAARGGVFLAVAFGVQVSTHGSNERDSFMQRAKITKCTGHQHVPVCGNAVAAP